MERQIFIMIRDTHFRIALRRLCCGLGYRVETAVSVTTALEIVFRIPVSLIVSDVSVQDVGDGLELAKTIHEQNPDAKCFLIVDGESSDVLSSTENEPWLRYAHKPFSMLRFAADLVEAIATSRVGDDSRELIPPTADGWIP